MKNISEEIRDLTANDIGQILGPLLRQKWKHWADDIWDIGKILRTLDRIWGHLTDIWDTGQILWTLTRRMGHWAEIGRHGQTLESSIFRIYPR